MKVLLSSFGLGVLFAVGLVLSGMTDPNKVLGFLDLAGHWDPSLAFVMMGAIGVHFALYRLILKRPNPVLSIQWKLPGKERLDRRLIGGAVLFGIGWGTAGFCPGPAVTGLGFGKPGIWIFFLAMAAGGLLHHFLHERTLIRAGLPGPREDF